MLYQIHPIKVVFNFGEREGVRFSSRLSSASWVLLVDIVIFAKIANIASIAIIGIIASIAIIAPIASIASIANIYFLPAAAAAGWLSGIQYYMITSHQL